MMEVTPHLKSVLKNYQHNAHRSLQGPGLGTKYDLDLKDEEVLKPVRVQQLPILTAADNTCSERTETILEGEAISCFVVGGEKRLCLPQILNTVLRDFSLVQINQECDKLQIFCSRCSLEQLNVLKSQGILPSGAPSCGLITKTDAERLCSALLHGQVTHCLRPRKDALNFSVYHECFGECRGVCYPDMYCNKDSRCIECCECQGAFSPQHFVLHSHGDAECRTVHWGFDSTLWRAYLQVSESQIDHEQYNKYLDEMRDKYEGKTPFAPPPPIVDPAPNLLKKKIHLDIVDVPLKKTKLDEFAHIPYTSANTAANMWFEPLYLRFFQDQCCPTNRQLSAFKPFMQGLKDSKLKQASSYNGRNYTEPPVLQHPDRMIPITQVERFEGSYQPNVALAPHMSKKQRYIRQHIEQTNQAAREAKEKEAETLKEKEFINEGTFDSNDLKDNISKDGSQDSFPSPNEVTSSSVKFKCVKVYVDEDQNPVNSVINKINVDKYDGSDTEKNVIQKSPDSQNIIDSTVSVVQSTENFLRYNSEIELSTDTDDSASEAEKKPEFISLEDSLKDMDIHLRERILGMFRTLSKDYELIMEDNKRKEIRIAELENEVSTLSRLLSESESKINNTENTNCKEVQNFTSVIVNESVINTTALVNGNSTMSEAHSPQTTSVSIDESPSINQNDTEPTSTPISSILYASKPIGDDILKSPKPEKLSVISVIEKTVVNTQNTQEEAITNNTPD